MQRYIALIPAYEPDDKLIGLLDDLKEKGFESVVIDDGSGPDYADVFAEADERAIVLTHDKNLGKGAALKTGMNYIYKYMAYSEDVMTSDGRARASGKNAVIVCVDADGQHLAEDALRIARIAEARQDALVLGSRAFSGKVPARSMMGNTITRQVYKFATGASVRDTQTGLRAFGRSMIPRLLAIKGERYEYEINVLLELADEGVPIIEEDIETVYIEANRSSHFNTIRDSFKIYKEIIQFSASSLIGFAVDYLMFGLLLMITGATGIASSLVVSNIGARLVSASVNYTINRKLVFKSKAGLASSALKYFTLAAMILFGNTIVLSALSEAVGLNSMVAKVITEVIFFFISWMVQKYAIFYKSEAQAESNDNRIKSKDNYSMMSDGAML